MPARRKSNLLKFSRRTLRTGRGPKEDLASRLNRAAPPPSMLSDRAKKEWRKLMPAVMAIGTISRCDLRAFQLLCETLATAVEAAELIEKEGMTILAGSGGRKAHPAIKVLEGARRHAGSLLESFGLTPRGRQSVDVLPAGGPARDLESTYSRNPLLGGSAIRSKYFS
jgi:P27 family predicted phage terminase small subunit